MKYNEEINLYIYPTLKNKFFGPKVHNNYKMEEKKIYIHFLLMINFIFVLIMYIFILFCFIYFFFAFNKNI